MKKLFIFCFLIYVCNNLNAQSYTSLQNFDFFNGYAGYLYDVAQADVNYDGKLDLIIAGDPVVQIIYSTGYGQFNAPQAKLLVVSYDEFHSVATDDIDNDGLIEIYTTSKYDNLIYKIEINENQTIVTEELFEDIIDSPIQLEIHDFNSDGLNDIFVRGRNKYSIFYKENDGYSERIIENGIYTDIASNGDIDNDGDLEFCTTPCRVCLGVKRKVVMGSPFNFDINNEYNFVMFRNLL